MDAAFGAFIEAVKQGNHSTCSTYLLTHSSWTNSLDSVSVITVSVVVFTHNSSNAITFFVKSGKSPLMHACERGHTTIVMVLLEKNADLKAVHTEVSMDGMLPTQQGPYFETQYHK
jgi:ankyrin repeat protein